MLSCKAQLSLESQVINSSCVHAMAYTLVIQNWDIDHSCVNRSSAISYFIFYDWSSKFTWQGFSLQFWEGALGPFGLGKLAT